MKIEPYMVGITISIFLGLIGILYRQMLKAIEDGHKRHDSINKKVDELDKAHDTRLDDIEKDIVGIKATR